LLIYHKDVGFEKNDIPELQIGGFSEFSARNFYKEYYFYRKPKVLQP